jgi:hypothetical protein
VEDLIRGQATREEVSANDRSHAPAGGRVIRGRTSPQHRPARLAPAGSEPWSPRPAVRRPARRCPPMTLARGAGARAVRGRISSARRGPRPTRANRQRPVGAVAPRCAAMRPTRCRSSLSHTREAGVTRVRRAAALGQRTSRAPALSRPDRPMQAPHAPSPTAPRPSECGQPLPEGDRVSQTPRPPIIPLTPRGTPPRRARTAAIVLVLRGSCQPASRSGIPRCRRSGSSLPT